MQGMPSPRKLAATRDSSAGNDAGETVAVILMKTSFSSGNWLVSVVSSGSKKNSDIAVWAGSPALNGCVVEASLHGISIGGRESSSSAISRSCETVILLGAGLTLNHTSPRAAPW